MTEVVVVPEAEPEGGSDAVAFAAGVAAAEAAQAGEEAEEAAAVAEVAAEEAAGAVVVAESAASTAWAARDDVDQLRAEIGGQLDEIRGMVADLATTPAESELTPERVERENGPGPEDEEGDGQEEEHESKTAGRYGNPRWFKR